MWQSVRNRMYICPLRCHIFFKIAAAPFYSSTLRCATMCCCRLPPSKRAARHHLLVTTGTLLVARGAGIAVLLGKVAHRLVCAHHRHQLLEGDGSRLRVVHTAEKA